MKKLILLMLCTNVQAGNLRYVLNGEVITLNNCELDYQSHSNFELSEYFLTCDNNVVNKQISTNKTGVSLIHVNGELSLKCPVLLNGSTKFDFVLLLDCQDSVFINGFEN